MATRAESPEGFKEAPLLDHLEELRLRIIYALVFWGLGSSAGYYFRNQIIALLERPLNAFVAGGGQAQVVAQRLTDPLMTVVMVSLFGGLVAALPFIVYQLWAFVAPGLTRQERRWGGPFILGLGFSFALGVCFAYFVILPYAIPFLLGGFLNGVTVFLSIGEYISDVVTYLGIFGLLFELPITLFLLTKVGLVNASMLRRVRRVAVLVIVTASAIITPTADPVNLALMAVPLWLLYEVGILLSALAGRQARALETDGL
jgi:sec-independent protein translocase protein TatC